MLLTPGNLSSGGTVGRSPGRQRDGSVFINIYWKHTKKKPGRAEQKQVKYWRAREQNKRKTQRLTASRGPAFSFPPIDSAAYAHLPAQVTAGREHITNKQILSFENLPLQLEICLRSPTAKPSRYLFVATWQFQPVWTLGSVHVKTNNCKQQQ